MRIGEIARRAGVSIETLRYYERRGLLAEPGRAPSGHQLGPLLHVTNGESAGNSPRQTGLGGAVLSWQDVLHEGPVPAVPPPELRRIRARFLSECGWGSERSLLESFERRDRLFEQALAAGRHVVLWFEHDLYDQLQLLQILAGSAGNAEGIELIQTGDFLGPLGPEELESLWPERRPVTRETLEIARDAWNAFRAPVPTALQALVGQDTSPMPFLASAVHRLLEELPDLVSGLSRTERQLLEPLREGPRRAPELFVESQTREEAAFAGDAWIWKRLADLGPLVSTEGGEALPPPPPLGDPRAFAAIRIALTDLGRNVVSGKADRVEVAGIDGWLGGTRLGADRDWRWDRAAGMVRRRP
jgi:hypothetical protein